MPLVTISQTPPGEPPSMDMSTGEASKGESPEGEAVVLGWGVALHDVISIMIIIKIATE
jgi:hypothetical protein